MPNTCWETNTSNPNVADYVTVDFRVTWNADMTDIINYDSDSFSSADDIDTILCDIGRTTSSNIHSSISYTETSASTSMTTWDGMSKQNIALYNGLALGNTDAVVLEGETMDGCLGHASPNNYAQHAHSISPCVNGASGSAGITGSTTVKPMACNTGDIDCFPTDNSFMLDGWSTDDGTYGGFYGLAKDGHVIYGPYNSDGEYWTCDDVDMCNGFFLDDGSYGYASTTFFPYMVGCWGPAYAVHTTMPSCTI